MAEFNGFPPGDLRFISVPDLFFTRLLPQIDDLVELKVTLHLLWLRQRAKKQVISLAELHADETLIHSLAGLAADPFEAVQAGLVQGVRRESILYAQVRNGPDTHDFYAINSEGGRLAMDELKAGKLGVVAITGADIVSPAFIDRPNIFELYEENIGLISPILADELKEAELSYPPEWIEDAFKIAAENNVRKWRYIRAILERMAIEGPNYATTSGTTETDTSKRWFTDEEFKQLFKH